MSTKPHTFESARAPSPHTSPFGDAPPAGCHSPAADRAERAAAQRLLHAEAAAIHGVAERLNGPEGAAFHAAVGIVVGCADAGGTVLVTGLGKSGIIGQKISATLASLAIPSHFVHPAEAAHGDLGRFRPSDVCIALSYSGETDEVVTLASILKQDGLPIVSITRGSPHPGSGSESRGTQSQHGSSLERLATVALAIGEVDDGAFGHAGDEGAGGGWVSPAPTASTTATLALGDALAVAAAMRRKLTNEEFAKRHPGGSLGGLLRPVTSLLRFSVGKDLKPIDDALPLGEALAAAELPGVRRPGALLLVDRASGKLSGILTDADVRRLLLKADGGKPAQEAVGFLKRPVRELMTKAPTTLPAAALVRDAVRLVREHRRDEVPVVDDEGRPVGLLDVQDLIAMRLIEG